VRIIAGRWRGRVLAAPPGNVTRPTAERVRQAIFDMLWHAPWGGRARLDGARVLDAFAGTGAMGLEALSRGADTAVFLERDPAALAALRANIAGCKAAERCRVIAGDALRPPRATAACDLVFLDPPYAAGAVEAALVALTGAGWMAAGGLVVAEYGAAPAGPPPGFAVLAERAHGAAHCLVLEALGQGAT
jgi:16S rRNA (guanine966-N2)-methyltransferase